MVDMGFLVCWEMNERDSLPNGAMSLWRPSQKPRAPVQIVSKRDPHAFEVLPRRWVVKRTVAWISKHRRTVRDYERLPASHEAMILWAMISLMTRRLAKPGSFISTYSGHLVMHASPRAGPRPVSAGASCRRSS